MKKILILSIFALAALLVSCRKVAETAVPEESVATGGRLCVTGSISDDASAGDSDATKTVFECSPTHLLTPTWKEGDEIIGLWGENKSVTWSVKELSNENKAVFEYVSGTEPWEAGTVVNVIYAPGKRASDISGTGDERSLTCDLSSQAGTIDALGDYALMTGKGTIAGTDLALTFAHALAIVSLDTLKDLTAGKSYTVSLSGTNLANQGKFRFSGNALTFTKGTADGAITTSTAFTADADGKAGPVFFAVPQAYCYELALSVASGTEVVNYNLPVNQTMSAGNYYYKSLLRSFSDITIDGAEPGDGGVYSVEGGTFTITSGNPPENVTSAKGGDVITVSTLPELYYVDGSVTVKRTDTNMPVSFDVTSKTFIMPPAPVTITVTFKAQVSGTTPDYGITTW